MSGQFRRVAETPFLDKEGEVRCGIYEWSWKNPEQHGKFKIRFLSPDEEPEARMFYVEPNLQRILFGKKTRFLEAACAYGSKILAELGEDSPIQQLFRTVCLAIFRNRDAGHAHIGRQFRTAADFVDFGLEGRPALITPGLDADDISEFPGDVSGRASRLLREALSQQPDIPRKKHYGFGDVLKYYGSLLQTSLPSDSACYPQAAYALSLPWRQATELAERATQPTPSEPSITVPIHTFPERSHLDLLFTDGLIRRPISSWKAGEAVRQIQSALIFGPTSKEDHALLNRDPEKFQTFLAKIGRAVASKTPGQFDAWLRNMREHGYLSLTGDTGLKGDQKNEARLQASRMYSALLWMSYETMARCYGALMLIVYLDYCLHGEREPTLHETLLFRQMHFPQLYLAALPLDFLNKAQLRWIILEIRRLWRQGIFEPEQYDVFTRLLGIFGVLVRTRREADRKLKAAPKQAHTQTYDPHLLAEWWQGAEGIETNEEPVWLSSTQCPKCGSGLQSKDLIDSSDPSRWCVKLHCSDCEVDRHYYIDPALMRPDQG